MNIEYRVFNTEWRWTAVARSQKGLCTFVLPIFDRNLSEQSVLEIAGSDAKKVEEGFEDFITAVHRYIAGEVVQFNFHLDIRTGTPFMRKVWKITKSIPYGGKRTYGWIAKKVNSPKAARAVGNALAKNPLPLIIPCHRVIGKDGSLKGFSAYGGVELKRKLLEHEAVK